MAGRITIRPETHRDFKDIIALVLRSFQEGTDYSDGTDILALIEEIRDSAYHIPELSFVAEENGKVVGHFMFSRFPLSPTAEGGHGPARDAETVLLAPVCVHAEHFRQGIGKTMLSLGIEKARESGYKGIILEGDYHYYNRLGFKTSAGYGIYPTSGYPMKEPRCMMCQETYPGALQDIHGFVVYDMYFNA
ncbi:N-acetyltransferase [Christensenellaceae bacterium NSJ-44]|uniref:N-acetyltransferase n=1 Tax=Luoshenia tenuis TaxID=2763654 RepID=A0A926D138_9FIRM|nr:N-acetyltransferase [Luoshenia tenuis]MBC8529584.1 N-acetyltransferase [Luoshenia tenuis]